MKKREPVNLVKFESTLSEISEPINLHLSSTLLGEGVFGKLIENHHRKCLFRFERAGPMNEDGSRDIHIRLIPINHEDSQTP